MLVCWPMKGSKHPSAPPTGDDAHLILSRPCCTTPHGPSSAQGLTTAAFVWIEQLLDPLPQKSEGQVVGLSRNWAVACGARGFDLGRVDVAKVAVLTRFALGVDVEALDFTSLIGAVIPRFAWLVLFSAISQIHQMLSKLMSGFKRHKQGQGLGVFVLVVKGVVLDGPRDRQGQSGVVVSH